MEKNLIYTELLDIYKGLLTEKQVEAMEYYYDRDYSLSEISEIMDISRQGVHECIKKGCEHLEEYEKVLGLYEKELKKEELKEEILSALPSPELSEHIKELLDRL